MERPGKQTDDVINSDRDEPGAVVDDESRWLDEGGSNTQFRPAERVPVVGGVEPPHPETVVRPPASDTGDGTDGG